jgi:hypothetical protein
MEWKVIPSTDGKYEASDEGLVRNAKTGHIKSSSLDEKGYERMRLWLNNKNCNVKVHILIAKTFHGEKPFINAQVNHIDGNKTNNNAYNLEWCTPQENVSHSIMLGLLPLGENRPNAKHKECDILEMYRLYKNGSTVKEIALIYNDSTNNIRQIVKGEKWQTTYNKYFNDIEGEHLHHRRNRKAVVIDNGIETLEFESQTLCAKYLDTSRAMISYIIKANKTFKEYKISLK